MNDGIGFCNIKVPQDLILKLILDSKNIVILMFCNLSRIAIQKNSSFYGNFQGCCQKEAFGLILVYISS